MNHPIPIVFFCVAFGLFSTSRSEEQSTAQLLEQKEKWADWATSKKMIQLTGRYRAAVGDKIQLQRLDFSLVPRRGLPELTRVRPNSRLSVYGCFEYEGNDLLFRLFRQVNDDGPDVKAFQTQMADLETTDVAARYALVRKYQQIAEFFEDRSLKSVVLRGREETFQKQLSALREDADQLWQLVDPGPGFDVGSEVRQQLTFQVGILRATRSDDPKLTTFIQKHLPGWKEVSGTLPQEMLAHFRDDPVQYYADSDQLHRRRMERLLYRSIRRKEIESQLKSDGSNALALSDQLKEELPEEREAIRSLYNVHADGLVRDVEQLRWKELESLTVMLDQLERPGDISSAVDDWLDEQVRRNVDRGLEGSVRIAEEFLNAWGRWKSGKHQEQAIEYFKQAWALAITESPGDAKELQQRLENFGWTRLHDRWLTEEQVAELPPDDIELAVREGRVVIGMSAQQVRAIHGTPRRRIRMASSLHMEESWVFGNRLVVHLRRRRTGAPETAAVISIFQQSGR